MLSLGQDVLITLLVTATTLGFTLGLNRAWPAGRRRVHDEQVGWQLNILGTTYAVILGFMLYTEWSNFTAAKLNVDMEANAVRNVFRLAEGLPAPQAGVLAGQARAYVDAALNQDWPQMDKGQLPEATHVKARQTDAQASRHAPSAGSARVPLASAREKSRGAASVARAAHRLALLSAVRAHRRSTWHAPCFPG